MTATRNRTAKFLFTTAIGIGFAVPAFAQGAPTLTPPPVFSTIDRNGVDVAHGTLNTSLGAISTGGEAGEALRFAVEDYGFGETSLLNGTIQVVGGNYSVSTGMSTETFSLSGSTFTSLQGTGSTLSFNSSTNIYTYTRSDGTVYLFDGNLNFTDPASIIFARLTQITAPNGIVTQLHYKTVSIPSGPVQVLGIRLQSITNNLGYQIHFDYQADTAPTLNDLPAYYTMTRAIAINNAIDYCSPTADSCTGLTEDWPEVTLSYGSGLTVTDNLGRSITRTDDQTTDTTTITRAQSGDEPITVSRNSDGFVSSYDDGDGVWNYTYLTDANDRITEATIAPPLGGSVVLEFSDPSTQRPTSVTNGVGDETTYDYDSMGRLIEIVMPEGNSVEYTYDSNGNVTETRRIAKSGSGLSDIVTAATYPCTSPVTCNRPSTTTDAEGHVTNYSWSSTHGGLLSVTLPDPDGGGSAPRPETRYTYAQQYARYRNSSGTIVDAASPAWRVTRTERCSTGSSCNGTANESESLPSYGAGTSAATNLRLAQVINRAGNGAVSQVIRYTYDPFGNLSVYDGPTADDNVYFFYNAGIQLRGVIGVDPDNSNQDRLTQRYTYDDNGNVTQADFGTTTGSTLADLNGMTVSQSQVSGYDDLARLSWRENRVGSTRYNRTDFNYFDDSLPRCTTVRMNPGAFASAPGACVAGTEGTFGPDRMTRQYYDNARRLYLVREGFFTAEQTNTMERAFRANGTVEWMEDGNNNRTTYLYDGFDRLSEMRYPNATGSGSSTTDTVEYAYDDNGNITQQTLRDGQTINFTYDDLNRRTLMNLPGSDPDVTYTYDNFGRMTGASQTGYALTFTYDALGRRLTETGPLGTVTSTFRPDGVRNRITHPDGTYFFSSLDRTGKTTAIRLNSTTGTATRIVRFRYDTLNRLERYTWGQSPDTTRQDMTFDPLSRVEDITQNLETAANDLVTDFTYNPANQIATRGRTNDVYVFVDQSLGTTTYTDNGLNQYTNVNPPGTGSITPTYDSRGNMTGYDGDSYSYDSLNRLVSSTVGGTTVAYSYDPLGRLYSINPNGPDNDRRFLWDGENIIAEYNYNGSAIVHRYLSNPGSLGAPLIAFEGPGTAVGDRRYLHMDERGSVIAIADGTDGSLLTANTYSPYGEPGSANGGEFQYAGQLWLSEAGLYYMRNRFYHAELGRFMQTDPIGYLGGMNLYAYVRNNPINAVDPLGLQDQPPDCPQGPSGWFRTDPCQIVVSATYRLPEFTRGTTPGRRSPGSSTASGGGTGSATSLIEQQSDEIDPCSLLETLAGALAEGTEDVADLLNLLSDVGYALSPFTGGTSLAPGAVLDLLALGTDGLSLASDFVAGNDLRHRSADVLLKTIPLIVLARTLERFVGSQTVNQLFPDTPPRRCGAPSAAE